MQCELIRIHITWAFVESNNHCDLNQKALMVAFRLSHALADPVHPDLCTLIAVYIDKHKATDTAHALHQPRSGESQLVINNVLRSYD